MENSTLNNFEEGRVLLIDKPLEWTSFAVIQKIRSLINIRKVGHAGTLDPLATGLLIICTGKFTKRISEFMAGEKKKTGSFLPGAPTHPYDLHKEPEKFSYISPITKHHLYPPPHKLTHKKFL